MALSAAMGFVTSFAFKEAVDVMAAGSLQERAIVIALVASYAGGGFAVALFANLRDMIFAPVVRHISGIVSLELFRHLHQLSHRFHLSRSAGELANVVDRGMRSIDTLLTAILLNILPALVQLLIVTLYFLWSFGLAAMAMTVMLVLAYLLFSFVMNRRSAILQAQIAHFSSKGVGRVVDSFSNFEVVQSHCAADQESERYRDPLNRYLAASCKNKVCFAWLFIGQALLAHLLIASSMTYTVWGWSTGLFTVGDIVLVNVLLMLLFQPIEAMSQVYVIVQQGLVDIAATYRILDTSNDIRDDADALDLQLSGGEVRFDRVTFAYDQSRRILDDVSFTVPAGKSVAIVGASGAGKSTIARLMLRQYDVDDGAIRIDGQDIRRVRQTSLRSAVAIVPQTIELFDDTIGYNVRYGSSSASQADVAWAVRAAHLESVIDRLPGGLDAKVGERGLRLSGGERQRVAIARALLRRRHVLVLDEATSALDSRTENAIQAVLGSALRGSTLILIAHRLSTVVSADEIIVMEEGRIAERGTHSELLEAGGLYSMMWGRQALADTVTRVRSAAGRNGR
jgi:ATP-binding cassette subfamily B protein